MYPRYPNRFTAFDASAEKDCPEALSLPECFKKNGYYVVSNGKVFHNITDHADSWSEAPWRVHPDGYGKDYGRMKSLPVMFILKLYEVLSVSRLMLLIQLT